MSKPQYESEKIKIFEWPQPICEIIDKENEGYLCIDNPEDAKAVVRSLISFLNTIPFEFGGYNK